MHPFQRRNQNATTAFRPNTVLPVRVGRLSSRAFLPAAMLAAAVLAAGCDETPAEPSTGDLDSTIAASKNPASSRIAFVSTRDVILEIYTMNADGTGVTRLTYNTANDSDPSWSHNGNRIAFTSDRDGMPAIFTMNPDGSATTRLTSAVASDVQPAWSSDGKSIRSLAIATGTAKSTS